MGATSLEPSTRLRIALVAPPWFEVPPAGYGGIERMCSSLADRLVARGHDVTLIGAGRDLTAARFVPTFETPPGGLGTAAGLFVALAHAGRVDRALRDLERKAPFDVVHDHSEAGPMLADARQAPTVVTAHGPLEGPSRDYYEALPRSVTLVAISEAQRRSAPGLPWAGLVHNGVPVDRLPFSARKRDLVVFLGRMHPDKAPHLAIDAARAAGLPIVLAGKCSEPLEIDYFDAEVRPRLGVDAEFIGVADDRMKRELLPPARALVLPIRWEEPFGLVMVEAMACGTPVVALRRGAVPEVVDDGVSGIVVDDPSELPSAIVRAGELDPHACRDRACGFDEDRMAVGYEWVYRRAAAARRAAAS